MGNEAADRFLTCIMRRTEKDKIMRVGSVFLVVAIVPMSVIGFLLLFMIMLDVGDIVIDGNDFAGIILFLGILEAFVVFRMVESYYKHQLRDIEWTLSLTEYAKSYGHETARLEEISEEMVNNKAEVLSKAFGALFLLILVINSLQAFFLSINSITTGVVETASSIISFSVTILLCIGGSYLFVCIRKHDRLQCEYTTVWSELMKYDLEVEPMETGIKHRKLWPHLILIVVTLTIYAFIFAVWSIHTMNLHIARQQTYEDGLLKKIKDKEGATGVEFTPRHYDDGLKGLIERLFF